MVLFAKSSSCPSVKNKFVLLGTIRAPLKCRENGISQEQQQVSLHNEVYCFLFSTKERLNYEIRFKLRFTELLKKICSYYILIKVTRGRANFKKPLLKRKQ